MVNKSIILFTLIITILSFSALAAEKDCVYYFYGRGCQGCEATDDLMLELEDRYPKLLIERFDVYFSNDNYNLLLDYYYAYDISKSSQELPIVFISGTYLVGVDSITSLLEDSILSNDDEECPSFGGLIPIGVVGPGEPKNVLDTLTFFNVTGAGISSSFSPAALVLIVILLLLLMGIKDDEEMVKKGLVFIVGIFLAYFFFFRGWFIFMASGGLGIVFLKTIGFLAILVSLSMMKHFFGTFQFLFKNTPENVIKKVEEVLKYVLSLPGILIVGFITGMFTFGLASRMFMMLRELYTNNIGKSVVLPMSLFYILLFVIPMIAIVVVMYLLRQKLHQKAKEKHQDERKIESLRKHNLKLFNLLLSLLILVLGIILIFV